MATSASRGASKPARDAGRLKRIAALVALAVVTVLMLRANLGFALSRVDLGLALRVDPDNADIAEAQSERLLHDSIDNRAEAEALASRALKRSPLTATAARILATTREMSGDEAAARRLIHYSASLSPRDLPAQMWLIQDAVTHDDVPGALHHYDIALRTSDEAKSLLFPVLIKALGQPAVMAGLTDTIAGRPNWAPAFLDQAAREAQDMNGLAALIRGLVRHRYAVADSVIAEASARMVEAGNFAAAWQVYAAGNSGARAGAIQDPDFAHVGASGGPFTWVVLPADGLSVEPRRYGGTMALAYRAATGAGGTVVRQLLMLPAGRFSLAGIAPERADGSPAAQLRLTCAGTGQPIATIAADKAAFSQTFLVPAGCAAQWLEIVVDGGDTPLGASGAIGGLRIVRQSGG